MLTLLAQGNTGSEILSILDTLTADIEQENIDSVAEVFAVGWYSFVRPLLDSGGRISYTHKVFSSLCVRVVVWQCFAGGCYRRGAALRI